VHCVGYIEEGGERYAKKTVYGIHQKAMLQQEDFQVLYCVYYIDDIYAVPEYTADMGTGMGGDIHRIIQIVYNWQIFIKNQKRNEPVTLTDSRVLS